MREYADTVSKLIEVNYGIEVARTITREHHRLISNSQGFISPERCFELLRRACRESNK